LDYCHRQEAVVHAIDLPAELFHRAEVFEDFLRNGRFRDSAGAEIFLTNVPDAQFQALEKFINGYFDFQEAYSTLQQERLRRFQRYA